MNNYVGPLYNPYRIYFYSQPTYPYGYPQIHFEHTESTNQTINDSKNAEYININRSIEKNFRNDQHSGFNFNDLISLDDERINILGFSINIDDLILLVTLFTMFKESEEIDYILVIVLGLLLFSQD